MATYRFYAQLQKGTRNLTTSANTFSSTPTNSEAIDVVKDIRAKGKSELPRKAHDDFDSVVDSVIDWISNLRGSGMSFGGNGDIPSARRTFTYSGETYRLDIGVGGEVSEKWFV